MFNLPLIHTHTQKGHEKEALNLMSSYLPKDSANSSPYAEGGGLYAIGEWPSVHILSISVSVCHYLVAEFIQVHTTQNVQKEVKYSVLSAAYKNSGGVAR